MNDSISSSSPLDQARAEAETLRQRAANGLHATQDALKKGVEDSKAKINDAIDVAAEGVDQAHMYLKEQARERPIAVTAAAVGAGIVLGLILAGGRRR